MACPHGEKYRCVPCENGVPAELGAPSYHYDARGLKMDCSNGSTCWGCQTGGLAPLGRSPGSIEQLYPRGFFVTTLLVGKSYGGYYDALEKAMTRLDLEEGECFE
jgi:hypothetical protein